MRLIAVTWIDLIVATLLVVCGTAVWKQAEATVSYALQDRYPEKDEFLLSDHLRSRELRLKTAQSELDATRAKWIEQRLVGGALTAQYGGRVPDLERALMSAEKEAFEARRKALKQFTAADFRFNLRKRSITLVAGMAGTVAGFLLVWAAGSVAARIFGLSPNWRTAAVVASCVLAPVYGFETAGPLGAVGGAVAALLLFFRP